MRISILAGCLAAALLTGHASAQTEADVGEDIVVTLENGDVLNGILREVSASEITIEHEQLGMVRLRLQDVTSAERVPEEVEPVVAWTGTFDVSASGSGGDTDTDSFRVGLDAKREDVDGIDTFTTWYRRKQDEGETTEAKGFALFRHEWKIEDSRWMPFVQGTWERDQFTSYSYRLAVTGGAGYKCLLGPEHTLTGRVGLGASKKYKSDDPDPDAEDVKPEGLVGFDYLWVINETQRFSTRMDIYPDLSETGDFRSITGLAYEVQVDPASAWLMKLGYDHFYDSDPGPGSERVNYNYYIGLSRAF
jgi:putative salt-induced outer membrane protein YdiY